MVNGLLLGDGSGGGGGGGLHFRNPADSFIAADLATARTARDTYFGLAANAAALLQFQGDRSLAIILGVTAATERTFETNIGEPGDAYAAADWVERTDAVQGDRGRNGVPGAPGGGAWELVGTFQGATSSNTFVDARFNWDDDTDFYGAQFNVNATMLMIYPHVIIDPTDGVTASSAGTGSTNATRRPILETISGSAHMGHTAAGGALLSTSTGHTALTVRFFKYVPAAAQGGLTQAQVDARIATYARATPTGQIADAQIPTAIARDSEVTAAIAGPP